MIKRSIYEQYVSYTVNGQPHRPNGPAYEWYDGDLDWCLYGRRHRYYGSQNHYHDKWMIHGENIKKW